MSAAQRGWPSGRGAQRRRALIAAVAVTLLASSLPSAAQSFVAPAAGRPLPLPRLVIKRKPPSLFEYEFEDFELLDYYAHGSIKAPIAV